MTILKDKQIIAVDFDGTLQFTDKPFPDIGKPNTELIEQLKTLHNNGDVIILWTCRNSEYLDQALEWCSEQGLIFDAINDDCEEIKQLWGNNRSHKVTADFYLDDKAVPI